MAALWRVDTQFTGVPGAPYFNSLYFEPSTFATGSDASAQVQDLFEALASALRDDMTIQVQPEVTQIESTTGDVTAVEIVNRDPIVCSNAGEPLPMATQGLVRFRTGVYVAGRELRGRMFIPGITEPQCENGRLTSTSISGFNSIFATNLGAGHCVYSPTHRQFAEGVTYSTWAEFAVLRSRRD